jgi:hypothetical protein
MLARSYMRNLTPNQRLMRHRNTIAEEPTVGFRKINHGDTEARRRKDRTRRFENGGWPGQSPGPIRRFLTLFLEKEENSSSSKRNVERMTAGREQMLVARTDKIWHICGLAAFASLRDLFFSVPPW